MTATTETRQYTATVTIGGDEVDDIVMALEEVLRLVKDGFSSGFNENESGEFTFQISGYR